MNPQESTDAGMQLYSFLEGNNLVQLITEPTRVTRQQATILDVVITSCPNFFVNTGTLSPPSNCDHSVVFAQMYIRSFKCHSYKREVWNFSNVDISTLNNELLETDWYPLLDSAFDIDDVYDAWFTQFRIIVEKYIPLKSVIIRPRDKPWMNGEVRRAIRKRDRLLRIHNKKPTDCSWEFYRRQRNFTTNLIRLTKKLYYDKVNKDLSDPGINTKKWWSLSKHLCGTKNTSKISTIVENDVLVTDSKEKACIFNDYFVAQTQLPGADFIIPPDLPLYQSVVFLSNVWVTEEEILTLMQSADISKACGCDGIGNKIIKLCSEGLHAFFTNFVNLSFALGQYPTKWKLANVIPLFKKDNRQLKTNYRPVSLLPCLSKICEKVVFIRLYNFLLEIGFLYKFQSGFRPGDSTVNQLLYFVHQIYCAFENGKEVRTVYLDISKAFDRVWHAGLLKKLEALGVRNPLLQWIKSYLQDRMQRVVLEGQSSEWKKVSSGVPQGSVLGPLLFLIYINDITDDLESNPFIYADDTTLFEIVDDPTISADRLNNDLLKISEWSDRWLMTMNPSKTRSMTFSNKREKGDHPMLLLRGCDIEEVDTHTHLGLTFQSNMSWNTHIATIYEKGCKRLNMLKSLKFQIDRSTLACLYKSLIRPTIEYGDVIWDNCTVGNSQLLESVQYESARVVTGAIRGTSASRLREELAWEDLSTRRKIHKVSYFYKIVNKLAPMYLVDLLPNLVSERSYIPLRSGQNTSTFVCRTEKFRRSFFPSTVHLWNSLDLDIRNSISLPIFKLKVRNLFHPLSYNKLFNFSLTRRSSVLHTRLRLGFCALNYYLYKINCCNSPLCACGLEIETVKHYFLICPRFAAQRATFLTSAAQICGQAWLVSGDNEKLSYILNGSKDLSYQENCSFFRIVQQFISNTNRFSLTTV